MRQQVRPGSSRPCPFCASPIVFTTIHVHDGEPFLYSDAGTAVLLRGSDASRLRDATAAGEPAIDTWQAIAAEAPQPPSGGRFTLWANIRCPSCGRELPYDEGRRDTAIRLRDHVVVLVDGAVVIGDTDSDSFQVRVVPVGGHRGAW